MAELLGKRFNDITHPEDRAIGTDALRELVAELRDYATLEKRYLRKDGSQVWVRLDIVTMRDDKDRPTRFVASIDDLTDHKRAETERLQGKEQLIAAQHETLRQLSIPRRA